MCLNRKTQEIKVDVSRVMEKTALEGEYNSPLQAGNGSYLCWLTPKAAPSSISTYS